MDDGTSDCGPGINKGQDGHYYCRKCFPRHLRELEASAIDARQARLHVETICGMGLRYATGKWVLAADIRGVCLSASGERLTLKCQTLGAVDVTEQPYLTDLIDELGLGGDGAVADTKARAQYEADPFVPYVPDWAKSQVAPEAAAQPAPADSYHAAQAQGRLHRLPVATATELSLLEQDARNAEVSHGE
jgi:hypothetical protein